MAETPCYSCSVSASQCDAATAPHRLDAATAPHRMDDLSAASYDDGSLTARAADVAAAPAVQDVKPLWLAPLPCYFCGGYASVTHACGHVMCHACYEVQKSSADAVRGRVDSVAARAASTCAACFFFDTLRAQGHIDVPRRAPRAKFFPEELAAVEAVDRAYAENAVYADARRQPASARRWLPHFALLLAFPAFVELVLGLNPAFVVAGGGARRVSTLADVLADRLERMTTLAEFSDIISEIANKR